MQMPSMAVVFYGSLNMLVILRAAKRRRRIHAAVDEHTLLDSATARGMTSRPPCLPWALNFYF
jgi:hypothetical protein